MNYQFFHKGRSYGPDSNEPRTTQAQVDEANRQTEQAELDWLKTAPDKVVLYVVMETPGSLLPARNVRCITTWLGTVVSTDLQIGRKVNVGGIAGAHAWKRAVDCRIFGTRDVGWYYESAGQYCRLKKATRQ